MSDWIGPGNYRIESFQNRGAAVAVRAGSTDVVQKSNMADADDLENTWTIAFVGNGTSQKDEYLIINRGTGLHLTANEPPGHGAQLTVTKEDPVRWRCRWNIVPTRNNTSTFFIVPSRDATMKLAAESETTADGAKILTWKHGLGAKGTWWYLEMTGYSGIQTLDLGAAPKHCH